MYYVLAKLICSPEMAIAESAVLNSNCKLLSQSLFKWIHSEMMIDFDDYVFTWGTFLQILS